MKRHLLLLALLSATAYARTPEGPLGPFRTPNDGRPVIATPGGQFEILVERQGEIAIESGDELIALQTEWGTAFQGGIRGRCTLPATVPEGPQALVLTLNTETDRNARALFVVPAIPDQYAIACISAPGSADPKTKASSENRFQALNKSPASFALIFATDQGDGFGKLLSDLSEYTKPTFVVPVAEPAVVRAWFGPATFDFTFGKEAFAVPALGRSGLGDSSGDAVNDFARMTSALQPGRWAVCVMPHFETGISMRNELTLFVDRPFDVVLCGPGGAGAEKPPKDLAWTGWFAPIPVYAVSSGQSVQLEVTRKSEQPYKVVPLAGTAPPVASR